jgi:hypothetical protein
MNRAERLQELLRLDGLIAAAKARSTEHRVALNLEATGEYEREGMAPTWRWPDLGTVILPLSQEAAVVSDPEALLAWCSERHPEQVFTVVQIRPAYVAALLQGAVLVDGTAADPSTGEVIPGLAVRTGGIPKALTIRATPDATAIFTEAGRQMLDQLMPATAEVPGGAE